MQRSNLKIRSSDGGEFDCYISAPDLGARVPGRGARLGGATASTETLRAIADEFAAQAIHRRRAPIYSGGPFLARLIFSKPGSSAPWCAVLFLYGRGPEWSADRGRRAGNGLFSL